MNNRIFFLTIILITSILYLNNTLATEMQCLDEYEISQNDEIIKKCYEIKTIQYNSTRPEIKVDFNEDITLKNYELKRIGDLGTDFEQNDTDLYFENIDGSVYQLKRKSQTTNIFEPESLLSDGTYLFKINAVNNQNILINTVVFFEVNASQVNFWVTSPANHNIPRPHFAASSKIINNITIETENPVSECKYLTNTINLGNGTAQNIFDFMSNEFEKITDTSFKINDFNFNTGVSIPNSSHNFKALHIVCREITQQGTPARYSYKRLEYVHLPNPPTITTIADPSTVISYEEARSVLNITTTQTSACTISLPQIEGTYQDPRNPTFKFDKDYLFNKLDYYKKENKDTLNFFASPTPYEFSVNVTCTNLANLSNSKIQKINVDFAQTANFEFTNPKSYVNSKNINVSGGYTLLGSQCHAKFNDEETTYNLDYISQSSQTGRYIHQKTITKTNLEEGNNRVYVQCEGMHQDQYDSKTFTIDTKAPINMTIKAEPNSCSSTTINAAFDAEDENGIDYFEYEIEYLGNKEGNFNRNDTTSGTISIRFTQSQGLILENETFKIKARAIDDAGNPSSWVEKIIKMTPSNIIACDFTNPTIIIDSKYDDFQRNWIINVSCIDRESGCEEIYIWETNSNTSETCNVSTSKTQNINTSLTISQQGLFCAQVSDLNNNIASRTIILNRTYDSTCEGMCGTLNCPPCDLGESCEEDEDCNSNYCKEGTCSQATCTDGIQNGLETGIDCGGNCPACEIGGNCLNDADCKSKSCENNLCVASTCNDNKQSGNQTDIDCGGECPPCSLNKRCTNDEDCESEYCDNGRCSTPPEPEKPENLLGLILIIIGLLAIIGGTVLLYLENKNKKNLNVQTNEYARARQQINAANPGMPRTTNTNDNPSLQVKKLSPEQELRRKQAWVNTIKQKDKKRKSILGEFEISQTEQKKLDEKNKEEKQGENKEENKEGSQEKLKEKNQGENQKENQEKSVETKTDSTQKEEYIELKKDNINQTKKETETKTNTKDDEDFFNKLKEITEKKEPKKTNNTKKPIKKK